MRAVSLKGRWRGRGRALTFTADNERQRRVPPGAGRTNWLADCWEGLKMVLRHASELQLCTEPTDQLHHSPATIYGPTPAGFESEAGWGQEEGLNAAPSSPCPAGTPLPLDSQTV